MQEVRAKLVMEDRETGEARLARALEGHPPARQSSSSLYSCSLLSIANNMDPTDLHGSILSFGMVNRRVDTVSRCLAETGCKGLVTG